MASKNMKSADVEKWCAWFACNYRSSSRILTDVDFSNNFISDDGMQILLQTLIQEGFLVRKLKAFGNMLTCEAPFVEYLEWSGGELHELHLSDNLFDAGAVCRLFEAAVTLSREGRSCYPVHGKTPFWLRIGGGGRQSYDPKALESKLRQALESQGRSLAKDVHVTENADRPFCNPRQCCRKSPTPAVHGPYLFPHWRKQVPCLLKEVNEPGSTNILVNYPPIVTDTNQGKYLDISGRGIRDVDLPQYINWMKAAFNRMKSNGVRVQLKEVDISNNCLTLDGLIRVIKFLKTCMINIEVLKMVGNASGLGEDVDFTLAVGGDDIKKSKRCALRTEGCTCGRNCETFVERRLLENRWHRCIDLKKRIINMGNQGIDDEGMDDWCMWFADLGLDGEMSSIDFSINYLTTVGVQKLLDTFTHLNIRVGDLRLYDNKICLDYGGPIQNFVVWNRGFLAQLHLSKNKLTESAIVDILLAAINLRDEQGQFLYPIKGKRPLWFRADTNNYDSASLEEQLRDALSSGTSNLPSRSLDDVFCNVTHAMKCNSVECKNTELKNVPVVHGVYLFKHWERATNKDEDQSAYLSRPCNRVQIQAKKIQLQSALRALAGQMGPVQVMQQHAKPIARVDRDKTQPSNSALDTQCAGFCRPKPKAEWMRNIAGGLAARGKPNCFTSQTLFRRANIVDSYVSAAELRKGDLLVGPRRTVRVDYVQHHTRKLCNIVRIRVEHSDKALVLTSDHRVQVDLVGTCKSAGAIFREFEKGKHPVVSDGSRLHAVTEATYNRQSEAVIEVKFAGDDIASVWLRPRRWRSRSADCPLIGVRGERLDLISLQSEAALWPEDQERCYSITVRNSFVQNWSTPETMLRRSSSVPARCGC